MFAFENLQVYKKAFELNRKVYRFVKANKTIPIYLKDQLGRASLSVMLNIAEGSGKFSSKDRRNFFVIARGSSFECAAIIDFLYVEKEIPQKERAEFMLSFEEISKMLYVMIKNIEK